MLLRRCGRISTSMGAISIRRATRGQIFLPLGGATESTGYALTAGYTIGYGRFTNNASLTWNRSHATTRNYFTGLGTDPAAAAGVLVGTAGIQANPFFASVPTFELHELYRIGYNTTPNNSVNQTISFSDFVSYRYKKHNLRFGGDIRRLHADSIGGTNVQGAFTFTGYATQNACAGTTVATATCPVTPATNAGRVGLCGFFAWFAAAGGGSGGVE